jgi:hypothetical protein
MPRKTDPMKSKLRKPSKKWKRRRRKAVAQGRLLYFLVRPR